MIVEHVVSHPEVKKLVDPNGRGDSFEFCCKLIDCFYWSTDRKTKWCAVSYRMEMLLLALNPENTIPGAIDSGTANQQLLISVDIQPGNATASRLLYLLNLYEQFMTSSIDGTRIKMREVLLHLFSLAEQVFCLTESENYSVGQITFAD